MTHSASRHFTLEPLARGVWAAIHSPGGWAISNAGIVDLGGTTLVFDTFLTPAAARDLHTAAMELTGRAPALVLNSHFHNDHTRGNQAFPEATLVATKGTRDLFLTRGLKDLERDRKAAPAQLERLAQLRREHGDETEREVATFLESFFEGILASLPELSLRVPEVAVEDTAHFHGSARSAQLLPFGGGHSGDDAILLLPDDGVVFCSDLLFVDTHPLLVDGDPYAFLEAGERLAALDADRYVSGHGPVVGSDGFRGQHGYVEALQTLVRAALERGEDAEVLAATPIPEEYRSWDLGPAFFEPNLRFLHELATANHSTSS